MKCKRILVILGRLARNTGRTEMINSAFNDTMKCKRILVMPGRLARNTGRTEMINSAFHDISPRKGITGIKRHFKKAMKILFTARRSILSVESW
jgi:hypothetical protein